MATFYYVHDPMCSWCWGYRPTWLQLREALPPEVAVVNVLGGLAPDTDEPMSDHIRGVVQSHWRKIHAVLGTEFNFEFWDKCQPRRDTYKACRAVVVAEAHDLGEAMIEAIQRAYYLRAMNPSEPEVLADLAAEIGLDPKVFSSQLFAPETEQEFQRQLMLSRRFGVRGYPALVFQTHGRPRHITLDYHDYQVSLGEIEALLAA